MARDYPGRAEWEDEMKAELRVPTWEILDKADGTVCPPGLLISIGDGSAVALPDEPTEAMWGGLARDIVMWRDLGQPTGAGLYRHLRRCGREVPAWLPTVIRDIEHVPAKGDVAVAIWRAMLDVAIQQAQEARDAS